MKRISISYIHILIALVALALAVTRLEGQVIPGGAILPDPMLLQEKLKVVHPEIIAYQLVPGQDDYCHFEIKLLDAVSWNNIPDVQLEETKEIIYDRIIFEETNSWAVNEVFYIDDKAYFLVRIPYTGFDW